jgi:hypothetical protein
MNPFEEVVETLRDAELVRYTKEYVALYMNEAGELQAKAADVLDLLCAEFMRRGKERLYDAARGIRVRTGLATMSNRSEELPKDSQPELSELDFSPD